MMHGQNHIQFVIQNALNAVLGRLLKTKYAQVIQISYIPFSGFAIRCSTTRVGTLILATIYLQLIQNRYMFRSFTVLQCSHQHCIQHVASDVEVVGYL